MPRRQAVLETLADRIAALRRPRPLRVAIDGADAAGKTTLATELEPLLRERGRSVLRASIDDFLYPRAVRYRRGSESPDGYYLDSFDHQALRAHVLAHDEPAGAVLLVDGVFLLRPELEGLWDFSVFVEADFDELLRRGVERDAERFGSREEASRRYETRYLPAQARYLGEMEPARRADAVLENTDARAPTLRHSGGATPT
jgi:uridine kinase